MNYKHYPSHNYYNCINAYKELDNPEDWLNCPNCNLKPKVWLFDNGISTACGCWISEYDHFSIEAESIMSYCHRNNKSSLNYDWDNLRKNWNHWVKTGEVLFNRSEEYAKTGRW